jgi:hypothetical protein
LLNAPHNRVALGHQVAPIHRRPHAVDIVYRLVEDFFNGSSTPQVMFYRKGHEQIHGT